MFGFDPDKSWISLLFAIIMLAAGGLPLLVHFGIVTWNLGFLTTAIGKFGTFVLAGGSLFLIIDSFMEGLDEPNGILTIIIGFLLLVIGVLPLAGVAIPFVNAILTPIVYYFIFTFEGITLFIGSFLMGWFFFIVNNKYNH